MAERPHNRIIHEVGTEVLGPIGLKQWKKSRNSYEDRGWHMIFVEFQPGWGPVTYLNVGVCTFLYDHDPPYVKYDLGGRLPGGKSYGNDDTQWRHDVRRIAETAIPAVEKWRQVCKNLDTFRRHVDRGFLNVTSPLDGWDLYYLAVIAGVSGDVRSAQRYFRSLERDRDTRDWAIERKVRGRELAKIVSDTAAFRRLVTDIVLRYRAGLKLPTWEGELFGPPR